MVNGLLKIISVLILLGGLLLIMIIKNISVQKQNYLTELKLTLLEEEDRNQLYKIEWGHIVSPINLKKIAEMVLTKDYDKYFIVLDKKDLTATSNDIYKDIINVVIPQKIINNSSR